ncbi:MAG: HTH-type transcriptional regulator TtgR [Pseudomonadota bacterium]
MAGSKVNLERRAEIGRERRAKTRTKLLTAAFELLGKEGGRSARIEEICQAADVARGTFYNYFTSVDEMFRALTFEISHAFNDATRAVIRRVPAGAVRSAFALRYYLHKARDDREWGWAMVNLSAGGPIFGEETYRYATESIQEGMATGQFHLPSQEIGRDVMMGGTLSAMITILRADPGPDYPEAVIAQILRGLGVNEALIEKCVGPVLPDPFEFLASHGAAPESDTDGALGLTEMK